MIQLLDDVCFYFPVLGYGCGVVVASENHYISVFVPASCLQEEPGLYMILHPSQVFLNPYYNKGLYIGGEF